MAAICGRPSAIRMVTATPFYEFMREVAPGDIVFSFCDTRIAALGIVSGHCRESPKPEEFGNAGTNWSQISAWST
jgi:putative restriction endonuclease